MASEAELGELTAQLVKLGEVGIGGALVRLSAWDSGAKPEFSGLAMSG